MFYVLDHRLPFLNKYLRVRKEGNCVAIFKGDVNFARHCMMLFLKDSERKRFHLYFKP